METRNRAAAKKTATSKEAPPSSRKAGRQRPAAKKAETLKPSSSSKAEDGQESGRPSTVKKATASKASPRGKAEDGREGGQSSAAEEAATSKSSASSSRGKAEDSRQGKKADTSKASSRGEPSSAGDEEAFLPESVSLFVNFFDKVNPKLETLRTLAEDVPQYFEDLDLVTEKLYGRKEERGEGTSSSLQSSGVGADV